MKKLYHFCLKSLLYLPFVRELAVRLDSRFDRKGAGVSDWLAGLLPCEKIRNTCWAENTLALNKSKVALVTTGGLFVKEKEPFRENRWGGDFSYRVLPKDAEVTRLAAARSISDHRLILMDPNIVYPIDRLKELERDGLIKQAAASHYSFLGFCSDRRPLVSGSAKEVARKLRYDGVDKVIVIAASHVGQETAVLVQRAIENEEIPTVSLIYSEEVAQRLKPPRACLLRKPSLCRLEEYLDKGAQDQLLRTLLGQFESQKQAGGWVDIA